MYHASASIDVITSIIIVHFPLNTIIKFIKGFEHIKDGDYSFRLKFKSPRILVKTAERFNNMAVQLQKTEMLSSDFIGKFSHEMKTPLASINGYAKLLKNDNISKEERNEYLDIIIQESENLSHLSKKILTLSKLEEQTELTEKACVNVSEQIREAIAVDYHKWSEKNLVINAEENDFFTSGDNELLRQVWINILDNAIRFSPDGGEITIRITARYGYLYISFSNQGIPIPKENHADIFKKFFQCENRDILCGNGLGLPLVKQIVQLHEGDVYVKKSDKTATVFEIVLPQI